MPTAPVPPGVAIAAIVGCWMDKIVTSFVGIGDDIVQFNDSEICQNVDNYEVDYDYGYHDFEKSFHGFPLS